MPASLVTRGQQAGRGHCERWGGGSLTSLDRTCPPG